MRHAVAKGKSLRLRIRQTWNRYAYVANNPLSYIDPFGLSRCAGFLKDYFDCDPVITGYNTDLFGGIGSLSILTTAWTANRDPESTGGLVYGNIGMLTVLGAGGNGGYLTNLSAFK